MSLRIGSRLKDTRITNRPEPWNTWIVCKILPRGIEMKNLAGEVKFIVRTDYENHFEERE